MFFRLQLPPTSKVHPVSPFTSNYLGSYSWMVAKLEWAKGRASG